MSQVVSTFRSAVATAAGAPFHALLVFVTTLLGVLVGGVLGFIPFVGPLVNGVVVAPLLLVATVGSAHAIRDGGGAFDGAMAAAKRAGPSVMGAYALLVALYVGVSLLLTLFLGILLVTVGMGGEMGSGSGLSAMTGVATVVGVVLLLAFLVVLLAVAMAVQFVAPAAVVAGTGAVDSLRTSYRFFRRNVLGVTGFSLVLGGLWVAAMLAVGVLFAIGRAVDPGIGLGFAAVGYVLAITAVGSISSIYQVGYFDAVVEPAHLPDGHDREGSGTETGDFVVGDVKRADAGTESATEQERESESVSETGGFHVEMAGEDERADEEANSVDEDSVDENGGWGTDPGENER